MCAVSHKQDSVICGMRMKTCGVVIISRRIGCKIFVHMNVYSDGGNHCDHPLEVFLVIGGETENCLNAHVQGLRFS